MEFVNSGFDDSIKTGIKDSFLSIIDEIANKGEILINRTILTTLGRDKYTNYIVNRIGTFPLFASSRTAKVSDVYIKVNISQEIEREKYKSISQIEEVLKKQKEGITRTIENESELFSLLNALNKNTSGFALLGNPGFGKTTAFRNLTVLAAQGKLIRGKTRIPIFLAARDMSDGESKIWDAAVNFFKWLDIGTPDEVFRQLLKNGKIILLLDGLDETNKNHQKKLINEIEDLQIKFEKSIFCISSRPYGLSVGLVGFTKWEVQPMNFDDRLEFIRKWFHNISPEKGERLIELSRKRPEILDLGSSPFFLSIVCALYYNDLDVPKDVNELYSRCLEGMLGGWDAFRNIARNTILKDYSLKRRKLIVNWIAAHLFQVNKIAFNEKDLEKTNCLHKIAENLKKDLLPAYELLHTLYNDFGILVERAPKIYSFSHLSLQEYSVAEYIVNNRQEISLLANYRNKPEWSEVIKLVARILPNANEFLRYYFNSINLNNDQEISLLINILATNPICSKEIELLVMRKIASLIARVTKFDILSFEIANDMLNIVTASNNIAVQHKKELQSENKKTRLEQKEKAIKEQEEEEEEEEIVESQDSEKRPEKKFKSHKLRTISNLPILTNVLLKSDFSLKDLNIENNPYFKILKDNNVKFLTGVTIKLETIKYKKVEKKKKNKYR